MMTTQVMHAENMEIPSFSNLLSESVNQPARDDEEWFQRCGQGVNPMVDAVTPLLGLVQRVRHLSRFTGVSLLYQQVVGDIQIMERQLSIQGYEKAELLSFRYMLCCFIDEAVMSQEWGGQSEWSEHSLLTRFHNETWGGEKVFVLLSRLQEEPLRYRHTLEFIYLCLCLGFEGRYRVVANGREELSLLIDKLHAILMSDLNFKPSRTFHLDLGAKTACPHPKRQFSLARWLLLGAGVLLLTFGLYHHQLHSQSQELLRQLGQLLK